MAKDLKIGEIVRLNSGSPELTVTEATDFIVKVEWCNEIGEVRRMICPPECFERMQPAGEANERNFGVKLERQGGE